jgi:uncharacterized protein YbjT (DUF2867 family)
VTTAIIGVGNIGTPLARHLTAGGESVVLAAKDESHAEALAQELGPLARAASVEDAIEGADAVVFAAGAGPGSGDARKRTVDFGGAVKLVEAAKAEGVSRYLIVSSMGADKAPEDGSEGFGAYLQAKFEADEAVRASGLDYTVVRPGGLTDDPGTGLVTIAEHTDRGEIPRADVAAVFVACLDTPSTIGQSFDLISGTTPIPDALP